jgi:curli biogenesis system outer membrane secretion channel CsgG
MKKATVLTLTLLMFMMAFSLQAADDKIRLGVLRFTNDTSAGWWSASVGRDLQDMLAAELASTKAFSVLERKEIDAVLSEQDLGASGRISSSTKAKMKKLKGAQYLVMATVSAFESDTSGKGGKVGFKGLSLGGSKSKSYVAVDLKVVDAETGEIADSRTIEAEAKASSIDAGANIKGFSIAGDSYKKTPTGKAIRACIMYIAEYLSCSLVEGEDASCMKKWNKMEEKRKAKTKDSIDID